MPFLTGNGRKGKYLSKKFNKISLYAVNIFESVAFHYITQ